MLQYLLALTQVLRKAGFNIAPSDITDCLQALSLIELNFDNFKLVLKACFVKNTNDLEVFEKIFQAFLSTKAISQSTKTMLTPNDCTYLESKASYSDGRGLGKSGAGSSGLLNSIINEDYAQMRKLIAAALMLATDDIAAVAPENFPELLARMHINLELAMVENHLEKYYQNQPELLNRYNSLLEKVKAETELVLVTYLAKNNQSLEVIESYASSLNYKETNFGKLAKEQVNLVHKQIVKLGKKLAVRMARRYKAAKKGQVSLYYTVRKAYSTGGKVIKIIKRKKIPKKPELLVLCDLSNSVKQYSMFFLLLVHFLQKKFRSVHTLIFVDRLEDITKFILQHDFPQVVEKSLFNTGISSTGFSDFGRVFSDLCRDYRTLLKPKTTVIILGDAKNNWRPSRVESMQYMAKSCAKIYWLNPRPRAKWYAEDSVLDVYRPYLKAIYECSTLAQLELVANQIF